MRTRTCFLLSLPLSLSLVLLCACQSASVQVVPMPPQDVAVSNPNLCRIYILRKDETRGSLRSVRVYDADTEIGSLDEDNFLCWERGPGRSLVRLYYEGVSIGAGEQEGLLDFQGAAGQRYVYAIGISYPDRKPEPVLLAGKDAAEALAARKPAPVH